MCNGENVLSDNKQAQIPYVTFSFSVEQKSLLTYRAISTQAQMEEEAGKEGNGTLVMMLQN